MTTLYKGPATLILDGGTSVEVTVLVQGRQEIHDTTALEPGGYREYTPGFQEWWGSYSLDNEDDSDTIFATQLAGQGDTLLILHDGREAQILLQQHDFRGTGLWPHHHAPG